MQDTWHIISGEYPPRAGGVSDYTVALSEALAERGCSVHLWVRGFETDSECINPNLTIHRCAGDFGQASLKNLGKLLAVFPGPRKILVQYVPHAYGFKAMNLGFAKWVRSRGRDHGDDVRIMFHEIAFPWVWWPLHHNLIAFFNQLMARELILAASSIYVSIAAWSRLLTKLGAVASKIQLLPIPSNVPRADVQKAMKMRDSILGTGSPTKLVGHFGTYGKWVGRLLFPIAIALLKNRNDIHLLLIGDGSREFRSRILKATPDWALRITATGRKSLAEIAVSIAACDVMVQPYADGVNTRRGSLMACIANGKAVVTTDGRNTETFWREGKIIQLVKSPTPAKIVSSLGELLGDEAGRKSMEFRGFESYGAHFSMENTVSTLLSTSTV